MNGELFADLRATQTVTLAQGAVLLRGFATECAGQLLADVYRVIAAAPLRHWTTPGGYRMSVAMTSCGQLGWVSDSRGYRYSPTDPLSGRPWPPLPSALLTIAQDAALQAGYPHFSPDACLINCYQPGSRLSLHQDRDELDKTAPIVSVSLGLPARFLFGGLRRTEPARRYPLMHGDVAVWGGPARFAFHGVAPVADGCHPATGRHRINITFRKAI